jgi:hypothetical protein
MQIIDHGVSDELLQSDATRDHGTISALHR